MEALRAARSCLIAVFTIAALLSTSAGFAQAPSTLPAVHPSPIALAAPKVGSASVPVVAANPHRTGLYVSNSSSVTLWVAPTGTAAAVNGAGSIPIQPQQGVMFGPPAMPAWTAGMNAVAPQDGPNVISVLEFQ
jgi:hypothetical protein